MTEYNVNDKKSLPVCHWLVLQPGAQPGGHWWCQRNSRDREPASLWDGAKSPLVPTSKMRR